ncbi:MAG: hypothetical protein GY862_32570, partial [Gammaproteobacteria bacterium]|nr:hypothetical protein [Gammaproteobacteria bacterium]
MDTKKLKKKLDTISKKLILEVDEDCVIIKHPDFNSVNQLFLFKNKSLDDLLLEIRTFLSYKYLNGKCIYKENYAELLIGLANSQLPNLLGICKFNVPCASTKMPNYEIGEISKLFFEFIDNTCTFEYQKSDFITLK